jgi:F-type H+-transporting ATPase subunit b
VELNWSTFIFEMINFLVLVWLLKRLLYAPVLNAIATRKKAVEQTLTEAEKVRMEAQQLQKTYEDRRRDWEEEKEAQVAQFQRDLKEQRARAMTSLENDLSKEREKQKALDERRLAELVRRREEEALNLAGHFSGRLLSRLAGPEVEARIVDVFLNEIKTLPEERLRELKNGFRNHTQPTADIKTAFALTEGEKNTLRESLAALLGRPVSCQFGEDPKLLAGLHVALGPLVLQANVRDELAWFLRTDTHEQ